jgi:hypothetical protein
MLYPNQCLGLPHCLFTASFCTDSTITLSIAPVLTTYLTYLVLNDLITVTESGKKIQTLKLILGLWFRASLNDNIE